MTESEKTDPKKVLAKAVRRAGETLGLSEDELAGVLGTSLSDPDPALDPNSAAGERAKTLIHCYLALDALAGGDETVMWHWMHTANRDTGGVPAEQMQSVEGLFAVWDYLAAARGRPQGD